jgi:hypothetical protein
MRPWITEPYRRVPGELFSAVGHGEIDTGKRPGRLNATSCKGGRSEVTGQVSMPSNRVGLRAMGRSNESRCHLWPIDQGNEFTWLISSTLHAPDGEDAPIRNTERLVDPTMTRIIMHGRPVGERAHLPPTGSSLIAVVSALRPRACRGPMAPGGEADRGSRHRRHPSRDAPVPSTSVLASRGSPQTRARAHGRPGTPRQAARPWERHGRAGRLRFSSPGRGRTWLPGASLPFL